MIKGIYQSSKYLNVTGGNPSTPSIYSTNTGINGAGSFVGQVKYNTTNQCLEIFDGSMWQQWNSSQASIALSTKAEIILDWADKKMKEELDLEQAANENTAVRDLCNEIKEKQNQIKMIQTLIKNGETVT